MMRVVCDFDDCEAYIPADEPFPRGWITVTPYAEKILSTLSPASFWDKERHFCSLNHLSLQTRRPDPANGE